MIDFDALIREADPARGVVIPPGDEAEARRRADRGGRPRRSLEVLAVGTAIAIAVTVTTFALTAGHAQPRRQSASRPTVPAAARPLVKILGVLRRPETPADRAAASLIPRGAPEPGLVRLAGVTPWGKQVILAPEKGRPHDTLDLDAVSRGGGSSSGGVTAGLIKAHGLDLLEGPGTGSGWRGVRLIMVVPDGVAKIAFVLSQPRTRGSLSGWRTAPAVMVPVHNNVAFVHLNRFCCGMPVTRWYATDGHLIKVTGLTGGPTVKIGSGSGSPAINLTPGVLTVARLREPNGTPFNLTLQRIKFQGQQSVCLAVAVGRATSQQCEGPLPLPDRPLVAVMGDPTVCKPHPAQLVWGLALADVRVALRARGRERIAVRRPIPAELRARGNLFYVWALSSPDSLVARASDGRVLETYPINGSREPIFATDCKHQPPGSAGLSLQLQTRRP